MPLIHFFFFLHYGLNISQFFFTIFFLSTKISDILLTCLPNPLHDLHPLSESKHENKQKIAKRNKETKNIKLWSSFSDSQLLLGMSLFWNVICISTVIHSIEKKTHAIWFSSKFGLQVVSWLKLLFVWVFVFVFCFILFASTSSCWDCVCFKPI